MLLWNSENINSVLFEQCIKQVGIDEELLKRVDNKNDKN